MRFDIILVEDDPYDVAMIEASARRYGLQVSWRLAQNEGELRALLAAPPDAIITDFNLPGFSGLRVLEIVRDEHPSIPVLVVTGAIDDELASECMKRGAADYLLKDRLARLGEALKGAVDRFRMAGEKRLSEIKLVEAARTRAVLNEMLVRSLALIPSEDLLKEVLRPVMDYAPFVQLRRISLDSAEYGSIVLERPASGPGEMERSVELRSGKRVIGSLSLHFAGQRGLDADAQSTMDQIAAVAAGVLDRAIAEKRLDQSLQEREELLREIHHRVQNNLAAISSLVSLEKSETGDEEVHRTLDKIESRVGSIALVHQMLYEKGNFVAIDFGEYSNSLLDRLCEAAGSRPSSMGREIDCGGLCLHLESAVTVGILLNELFRGAVERSKGGQGFVSLKAAMDGAGSWKLDYEESTVSKADKRDLLFLDLLLGQYSGSMSATEAGLSAVLHVKDDGAPGCST
jgi:two-component sensor histidine kinase/FixJ family two-component response regulator